MDTAGASDGMPGRAGAGRYARGVVAVLQTADRLRRSFERIALGHGITFQQYNVLRMLRGAGSAGLPTMEIRARMIERAPGVTRIVDRLVEKGWVERLPSAEDRRRIDCRITTEGLSLLYELDRPMDEADRRPFDGMTDSELDELIRLLRVVGGRLDNG